MKKSIEMKGSEVFRLFETHGVHGMGLEHPGVPSTTKLQEPPQPTKHPSLKTTIYQLNTGGKQNATAMANHTRT